MGHMVTGEPINVSEVTRFVCDMERWTRGLKNVFRRWDFCLICKLAGCFVFPFIVMEMGSSRVEKNMVVCEWVNKYNSQLRSLKMFCSKLRKWATY